MEAVMVEQFADWLADRVGWAWLKDKGLPWIGRQMMGWAGVDFFVNRNEQHPRVLDDLLGTANEIDAIVVIGRLLHETDLKNIRRIRRVIFPNPESDSSVHYAHSVNEFGHFRRNIAEASTSLKNKGIQVRWYPHALNYSMLIGDGNTKKGWVQTEIVMPYSAPNRRPSWRVRRSKQENLVIAMCDVFEKVWDESIPPDEAVIRRHLGN
jgi:hypothetical protein